jgi:hypothetical protein
MREKEYFIPHSLIIIAHHGAQIPTSPYEELQVQGRKECSAEGLVQRVQGTAVGVTLLK